MMFKTTSRGKRSILKMFIHSLNSFENASDENARFNCIIYGLSLSYDSVVLLLLLGLQNTY